MVKLYSTNCPKCKVLEAKMNEAGIQYEVCTNVDEMIARGMTSAPMLEVDGDLLNFSAANDWINGSGASSAPTDEPRCGCDSCNI